MTINDNKAGTPNIVIDPTVIKFIGTTTPNGDATKLYPYNKKE